VQEDVNLELYAKNYSNIRPSTIAQILIETPKEIKSRLKLDSEKIRKEDYEEVLKNLNHGKISKEAVIDLLAEAAQGKKMGFDKYKTIPSDELEKEVKKIIEANKGASVNALMGEVMKKYRGAVDGKKVFELLQKHTKRSSCL